MLKEIDLGSEAINYIQSCLSAGDTLSKYLLKLPLETGRVVTYLPADVSPVKAREFEFGGIATKEENPWSHLGDFILAYLSGQEKCCAIFESLARSGDPSLSSPKARFFTCGNEVYYFLAAQDQDLKGIRRTIRAARSYPFVGTLIPTLEAGLMIRPNYNLARKEIKRLAAVAEHILIGAYDDEGVLIWSKK